MTTFRCVHTPHLAPHLKRGNRASRANPRNDQKFIVEALVVLEKTRDKSNWSVPHPQIVASDLAILTNINRIDVMVAQVHIHFFDYAGYIINYFKEVDGTQGMACSKK